jgi:nucleoside-diphosphate-sugar epimerase
VLAACHAPKASGEIINLAVGGRISLLELIRTLQVILKTDVAPVLGPPREGDIRDSQADITKARQLLGFAPVVPFDEGLRQTVEWFQGRAR